MDSATTASISVVNNAPTLYMGLELASADRAREFVNAYAIRHNFAVKNGYVYNKDKSLLLLCKCAKKPSTRRLPPTKGATDDDDLNAPERAPEHTLRLSVDRTVQKALERHVDCHATR
ncbi:hypothetical protein V1525DRAFT_420325 [Lipomyces kononenkoae]|uniref:Uncharacterized protein n=1 Tax=Lipomyces kononenkoae TaxID=34357 RepID=A0ACC3SZH8_LIPKO